MKTNLNNDEMLKIAKEFEKSGTRYCGNTPERANHKDENEIKLFKLRDMNNLHEEVHSSGGVRSIKLQNTVNNKHSGQATQYLQAWSNWYSLRLKEILMEDL